MASTFPDGQQQHAACSGVLPSARRQFSAAPHSPTRKAMMAAWPHEAALCRQSSVTIAPAEQSSLAAARTSQYARRISHDLQKPCSRRMHRLARL